MMKKIEKTQGLIKKEGEFSFIYFLRFDKYEQLSVA
jgi:hypothetical protein